MRYLLTLSLLVSSSAVLAQDNALPDVEFTDEEIAALPDGSDGAIQLRPSAHWNITKGDRTSAFGLGLQYIHFPNEGRWNFGTYVDTQYELDGAWRTSGGVAAAYGLFGLRLGVAHRTAGDFAATTSLVIAKTVTMGPVGLIWQLGLPLANYQSDQGERLPTRGVEFGFALQVGWGIHVRGERPRHSCGCHCRRSDSCDVDAEPTE